MNNIIYVDKFYIWQESDNEKMPDVSLVPDGEYPFYSGEKNIIKFDIISESKIEKIKN